MAIRLTKIYTRTGDDGSTGLGDGSRTSKTDPRVEAYGEVDEANAFIGVALGECVMETPDSPVAPIAELLTGIQNDLFDVGADLCVPVEPGEEAGARLRVAPEQTRRLEAAIDLHNARLKTLNSFILPGGTRLSAALHVARTVVRRAERRVVDLQLAQAATTNAEVVRYLNRLSDLLFVLCRVANDDGEKDVLWVPGKQRGG